MKTTIKKIFALGIFAAGLMFARAGVIYDQGGGGAGWQSSWWSPGGSDYDQYTWDNFSISSNAPITEIKWRGGYAYGGTPVSSFTVSIYSSIQGGSQPDVGNVFAVNPLVSYTINGNAGQTPAGNASGVSYAYDFVLPTPFQATAGTVYWVQIEAAQAGIPDWAIGIGGGGDGRCFRKFAYVADSYYSYAPGDTAFTLLTADTPIFSVSATTNPVTGGTIAGLGLYPTGMVASLTATPAANFAFVNWTANGAVVSSSANYSFAVSSNRTLTANFAAGSSITTLVAPPSGGSVTGGGSYTNGTSVTLTAVTNANYSFVNWTENGAQVSTSKNYSFTVSTNRTLTANFSSATANPAIYFQQPPVFGFPLILSSFLSPNGMDGDNYAFDDFVLPVTQDITEIRWFGTYQNGDPVSDFTVQIYSSIPGGSQPDIGSVYAANPLKSFDVGGNAGEILTNGSFNYDFVLPSSFHAVAGVRYWVQIEAFQTMYLNGWSFIHGAGGNGRYFVQVTGSTASIAGGDTAFMLIGAAGSNSCTIATSAQPASGGITTGGGAFGLGLTNTVTATPNAGFIFSGWSENGALASTNSSYTFAVTTNRTLAALFNPVFTVTLAASPTNGGAVSGAGTFLARSNVTVTATANPGYSFVNWTAAGVPVSATTNYTFTINAAQSLTANFSVTPLLLNRTNAPGSLGLSWTPAVAGWVLQESSDLVVWTNSLLAVTTNGSQRNVTITPQKGNKFFRLRHP